MAAEGAVAWQFVRRGRVQVVARGDAEAGLDEGLLSFCLPHSLLHGESL